jgi:chitinase
MKFQNYTINYWIKNGASPCKIVMGMPMYGQSFSLAETTNNGLNVPTYGGGEAGDQTRARGFLSYYEVKIFTVAKKPGTHIF